MAIRPEDIGIDDQPDLDPKYLREPDNPEYQLVFPWGAGGNILRHLIALHPGQEYLGIGGNQLTDVADKFRDLIEHQYPCGRGSSSWLSIEWSTRHLYNKSRIEHHPPASWHHLPTIIINPDRPEIVGILYKIKNPEMNGWVLPELIMSNVEFSNNIPNEVTLYKKCLVLKFSDLIADFNPTWYHEIVNFLGLETTREIEDMVAATHGAWVRLQRDLWSAYFK